MLKMRFCSVHALVVASATLVLCSAVQADPLVVHTGLGWVRGHENTTRAGRSYVEFLGIHYAKAPTGNLRFKSPQQPERWDGVYEANQECSDCVQQYTLPEPLRNTVTGSEDCLCLNVYTPKLNSSAKLPVLLWIHGGGYVGGSGAKLLYGPELLLERDVVLVAINYRLGIMGFLSTGDSVISGNFGMKDQVLAMRWVKENIANFGGDSENIVLFGESAGAASVDLHQYSPLSAGLFNKAIQHSGSIFNPWAFTSAEVSKGRAATVAELVGCPATPSTALLECLQTLQPEVIVNITNKFLVWDLDPLASFTPTVEHVSVADAFLTEDPRTSSKITNVPLLTGFNNGEGGFKTATIVSGQHAKENLDLWNKEFDYLTAIGLIYNNTELDKPKFTEAIKKFYFGSAKTIKPTMLREITEVYGDAMISLGVLETVEKQQRPTFLYYYNYNKTFSMCPLILVNKPEPNIGACHYDELNSFFPLQGTAAKYDPTNKDPDYLVSVATVEMWTNFAKTGNPSTRKIVWNPVKSSALECLDISKAGYVMRTTNPLIERHQFWKKLKASAECGDWSWLTFQESEENDEKKEEKNKKDGLVTTVVKGLAGTLRKTTSLLGSIL